MDNQEDSLLAEIVENPDDDTPRLIYADWLEERGNPRAEFIRVQCELVNPGGQDPLDDLRRRERSLLAMHRWEWLSQLGLPLMWYGFRRGFVEDIVVHSRDFIRQAGRVLEVSPIRHLRTNFMSPGQAAQFARIPSLRHLHRLHVSARCQDRDLLYPLLESPCLADLEQLFLMDARLDRSGLDELRSMLRASRGNG